MTPKASPSYSDKLKDPRWQRKRLEILSRDGFSCKLCCEKEKPLNVHHLYYYPKREVWDYPSWALQSLCDVCHENVHSPAPDDRGTQMQSWEMAISFLLSQNDEMEDLWRIGETVGMARSNGVKLDEVIKAIEGTFA